MKRIFNFLPALLLVQLTVLRAADEPINPCEQYLLLNYSTSLNPEHASLVKRLHAMLQEEFGSMATSPQEQTTPH
jgi:hypothetical protein